MSFRRCIRCGKEFLARDDSQELCSPDCRGPRSIDADIEEMQQEDAAWWTFPLFFLICCILVFFAYRNAYDVELFTMRNLPFLRGTMARKLARACPESLGQIYDAVCGDDELARAMLDALSEKGDYLPVDAPLVKDLKSVLKEIVDDKKADIALRRSAVSALGCINDPEITDFLMASLRDPDFARAAVIAVSRVGSSRAVPALCDIVEDSLGTHKAGDIRYFAVIALGKIKDEEAKCLPVLVKALRDPSGAIRDEAITSIRSHCLRYKELSMRGKERAQQALLGMKRVIRGDRLQEVRDKGLRVIGEISRVID